ncbi:MAG TPA: glycosyltransferase family 2 protein [bacterium]|nr:glycosyltransferase family 2 protein [bacterium]HPN43247.1 glycosyltransferase family 2 protein [bacterium]
MNEISIIIITQNEAGHIRDCLSSISWADEIIVVDGGSSDDTLAICREFNATIYENPWPGFAAQKQYALDRATKPWVMSIDSDERVTESLKQEIQTLLQSPDPDIAGYSIPRLSSFLGKPIRHGGWYPGYQMRLFQKSKTRVSQSRVHEGFIVEGQCGRLRNDLLHFTHVTIEASLSRMNRYSSLEAQDRFEHNGNRRIHWYDITLHSLSAFWRQYVTLQGFRDGMHGFILATVTAMVKSALYMKLWEQQQKRD